MSRPLPEILQDSVQFLESIISGEYKPGEGDIQRNIDFINNILALKDPNIGSDIESACRNVIQRAEKLL